MFHAIIFLNYRPLCFHAVALAAAITCLLAGATSCYAQQVADVTIGKWRPKDGLYASPDKDFEMQCGEYGDVVIGLKERSVSGHEWGCKIDKLTQRASSVLQLNMTCNDLNLALHLKKPEGTLFKEVMLLKRIDERSVSVRRTLNGKFEDSAWRADYCPDEAQRMYAEAAASERARKEYKLPEELSRPNQWRPKDGIYAGTGPEFGDRCAKSSDIVVGLVDGSISSGNAKCKVVAVMNTGQAAMSLSMTCNRPLTKQAPSPEKKDSGASARREDRPSTFEVIRMSRIHDNSFHMQKTVNRKFEDDGGPVAYCPEEAQRVNATKKASK